VRKDFFYFDDGSDLVALRYEARNIVSEERQAPASCWCQTSRLPRGSASEG
jgi:hypothetical protein